MQGATVVIVLLSLYFSVVLAQDLHSAVYSISDKFGCQPPSYDTCIKCSRGRPKTVQLVVKNQLKEPFMDNSIVLHCTRRRFLLGMMEEAATKNKEFRFSATYYDEELGYFIDAFDSVYANGTAGEFWLILDGNMKPTPFGASYYRPKDGETVTFNLTTGGH